MSGGVDHFRIDVSLELFEDGLAVQTLTDMVAFGPSEGHGVNQIMKEFDCRNMACWVHMDLDEGNEGISGT